MRNPPTATQTIKRAVEDGTTLREVPSVEVNCVDLILHHVNSVAKRALEQREVFVSAVLAAPTVNLVVIKRLFWDEITHGVRMTGGSSLKCDARSANDRTK